MYQEEGNKGLHPVMYFQFSDDSHKHYLLLLVIRVSLEVLMTWCTDKQS